jgi:hypothetical protein
VPCDPFGRRIWVFDPCILRVLTHYSISPRSAVLASPGRVDENTACEWNDEHGLPMPLVRVEIRNLPRSPASDLATGPLHTASVGQDATQAERVRSSLGSLVE